MLQKAQSLLDIVRAIRNWQSAVLYAIGAKDEVTARFRNGVQIKVRGKSEFGQLYALIKIALGSHVTQEGVNKWSLNRNGLRISFSTMDRESILRAYVFTNLCNQLGAKFPSEGLCEFYRKGRRITYFFNPKEFDSIANLNITFAQGQYNTLNVKDRVVADVGAAYGDTALFFALNGAKRVYAYEPVPCVAEILRKNVEANGLGGTIETLPFAVSDREGEALLAVPKTTAAASLIYCHEDAERVQVKTVTPPSDADVLKLNCEGCEYSIILEWLKTRLYDQIIINYHADHVQLAKKLHRLGYKVRVFPNTHMLVAT